MIHYNSFGVKSNDGRITILYDTDLEFSQTVMYKIYFEVK